MKADDGKNQRDKVNEAFGSALYSRLNRKDEGFIIVVMQRIHEEDLVGHLLRQGEWDHLNLPAIAEQDEDISIDDNVIHHRRKGELLIPEYELLASLERTKRIMGTMHFRAQYQQAPIPEIGNLIRRDWIRYFETSPARTDASITQSWDTAMKGDQVNDYSVGTTWLHADGQHYLIDLVRKQCDYPTLSRIVLEQYAKHKPDALLIEDNGSGCALIQDLKQRHNISSKAITPTKDKVVRLSIVSPRFEAGEVFVPKDAPWLSEFLDELLRFPQSKFDDQVDSVTQYLNWYRDRPGVFEVFWA